MKTSRFVELAPWYETDEVPCAEHGAMAKSVLSATLGLGVLVGVLLAWLLT